MPVKGSTLRYYIISVNYYYLFGVCRFTSIPRLKHPEGATPTEVTQHNIDLSYTLESLIETNYENGI